MKFERKNLLSMPPFDLAFFYLNLSRSSFNESCVWHVCGVFFIPPCVSFYHNYYRYEYGLLECIYESVKTS
jgi:hypothetical protein